MQKIRLTHPPDQGTLSDTDSRLRWAAPPGLADAAKPRYLLTVYATRPASAPGGRGKLQALFTSEVRGRSFLEIPLKAKGLSAGRSYWWQVRALGDDGQVAAISDKWRFKVKKELQPVDEVVSEFHLPAGGLYLHNESGGAMASSILETLRERAVPPAPAVWGKPVKLRLRGEGETLSPSDDLPEGPGTTEPQPLVWGNEAAEVYLPHYLITSANLSWDLSHIDGCTTVLLQVSGSDGFSQPGDGDVLDDVNVISYYWGPPRTTCGSYELESPNGSPPASYLRAASDLNLLDPFGGDPVSPPSGLIPEIVRQIRIVPCNEERVPVDIASDPVTLRCVRYPVINIGAMTVEWIWGDEPQRVIEFSLLFQERFPKVNRLHLDEETGLLTAVTAPSSLLIYTPPTPSMMSTSSCANLSLTMNGEPVIRQNSIILADGHPLAESYVIPLDPWPEAAGYDFRLVQQWRGGMVYNTLWDFLDPQIVAAVIPGVHPSWHYCGGVFLDVDSLYGREDLPEEGTNSPLYNYHHDMGGCLPRDIVTGWYSPASQGIERFNEFLGRTFRGTRRVSHDLSEGAVEEFFLDEPEAEREVVVVFETDNPSEFRYVLPNTHYPVTMRETRGSRQVSWQVRYLDGVVAGLETTRRRVNIFYGGRGTSTPGRSRLDPPRLEMWFSVRVGANSRGSHVWADIHYDLIAD